MRTWASIKYGLFAFAALASLDNVTAFPGTTLKPLARIEAIYPEGVEWIRGSLYFAEMYAERVMVLSDGKLKAFWKGENCGPTSISSFGDGVLVTCHLSDSLLMLDMNGLPLRRFVADKNGIPFNNPNDSYPDRQGGVYFTASGDFSLNAKHTGKVLYLDAANQIHVCAESMQYANGIVFDSSKSRILISEHLGKKITSFQVRAPCDFIEEKELSTTKQWETQFSFNTTYALSGPDGLTLDKEGNLVVAYYGAGALIVLDSLHRPRSYVKTPFQYVTNVSISPDQEYMAVSGSYINDEPPYTGEILVLKRSHLY